jgi:flagellar export protein FliJ
MADLDPLIRYRKFELDEKQRKLARLYQEQEQLEIRKKNMLDQMRHEQNIAEELNTVEALSAYTQYSYAMKFKIEEVNEKIRDILTRVQIAQNDIQDAFGELKKVEITHAKRLEELAAENKKKEDDFFSEVAIQRYQKRLKDEEEDEEN